MAYSHKLWCLHYIGRCWRKLGRDIKEWTYFGNKHLLEKDYRDLQIGLKIDEWVKSKHK